MAVEPQRGQETTKELYFLVPELYSFGIECSTAILFANSSTNDALKYIRLLVPIALVIAFLIASICSMFASNNCCNCSSKLFISF